MKVLRFLICFSKVDFLGGGKNVKNQIFNCLKNQNECENFETVVLLLIVVAMLYKIIQKYLIPKNTTFQYNFQNIKTFKKLHHKSSLNEFYI